MGAINVSDKVQIVKTNPGEEHLLNKIGRVMLIVDGERCVVALPDGNGASVNIKQLKKLP